MVQEVVLATGLPCLCFCHATKKNLESCALLQQTPHISVTIHSNSCPSIGLIRDEQPIVRILGAEVETGLQR